MIEVRLSALFASWLGSLRHDRARDRILARLRRFELDNFGDVKPVGEGLSEARIDCGPGYRLYFVRHANVVVIMLCGGDKASQGRDIALAKKIAREL